MQTSTELKRTQKIIKQLKKKVVDLQGQLCQRTRNYLLRTGVRTYILNKKVHQQVQTQTYQVKSPSYFQYLDLPSPFQSNQRPQISNQNICIHQLKNNVSSFQAGINSSPQRKANIGEILQKLFEQKNIEQQKSYETDSVNDTFISQSSEMQKTDAGRQKRSLRRQIKKLTAKLEFQKRINLYAKEGLLISEQENYQFRLQIKQLQKYQHSQISALKDTEIKLQQQLEHQISMKEQYLRNCLFLNDQNEKLQNQIKILKNALEKINGQNKQEYLGKRQSILIDKQVLEQIKSIAFSISNCIPITQQWKDVNFFRPQNEVQLLQTLQRVQQYCKQIEKEQLKKINIMNLQRQLFTTFILEISSKIDNSSKKQISQSLGGMSQMKHFTNILTKRGHQQLNGNEGSQQKQE